MLVPVPPNGLGQGWEDMGNGKMSAKMFRFLQRDVNEGRIWYQNTGSKSTSDIVTFEVFIRSKSTSDIVTFEVISKQFDLY